MTSRARKYMDKNVVNDENDPIWQKISQRTVIITGAKDYYGVWITLLSRSLEHK